MNKKLRQQVYNKYNGHCAYCGKRIEYKDMQVDHIIPLMRHAKPGIDANHLEIKHYKEYLERKKLNENIDNMNPACARCNRYKSTMDLETFREQISEQVERARRYSWNFRIAEDFGLILATNIKVKFYFEKSQKFRDLLDGK